LAKHYYFILAIFFGFECAAQNLRPDRFGLGLYGESYSDVGLSVDDAFKVTGFPELEIKELEPADFEKNSTIRYSILSFQFGYKLFKRKELKRSTFLDIGVGYGRSSGYGNIYFEQIKTTISRTYRNSIYYLDSTYRYFAVSRFQFESVFSASINLEKDLVKFKSLSIKVGFMLDYNKYQNALLDQDERGYISYSDFFKSEFIGERFISMSEISTTMHSFGLVFPVSYSFDPRINNIHLDRFSLGLSFTRGMRFSFISNVSNFNAKLGGIKLILRYSFLN